MGQRADLLLQLGQGVFGLGAVQVVDVPVLRPLGPIGKLLVYGQYVAYIQAPPDSEVVRKIADELRKEGYIT